MPAGEKVRMMANELKATMNTTTITRAKWLTTYFLDRYEILHFIIFVKAFLYLSIYFIDFPHELYI